MALVSKSDDPDGCWLWTGTTNKKGYGKCAFNGAKGYLAHRASYTLFVGDVEPGYQLHHVCCVKRCVNPAHLQPVTPKEHVIAEPSHQANRTHCVNGHLLTPDNLTSYGVKQGLRKCRKCEYQSKKRYLAKKRAEDNDAVKAMQNAYARAQRARRKAAQNPNTGPTA